MNKHMLWLFVLIAVSWPTSCCKDTCSYQNLNFYFIGFNNSDIESLWLTRYKGGTNFSVKIDSMEGGFQIAQMDTLVYFFVSDRISYADDYTLTGPSFPNIYHISQIHTVRSPYKCCGRHGWDMDRFLLEDSLNIGTSIYLRK
jgi:hypothetical protein